MNPSWLSKTVLVFVLTLPMFGGVSLAKAKVVKSLSIDTMRYPSSEKAAAAWHPMQGALAPKPAMVNGVRCLTLPCQFLPSTQRAIWDQAVDLDLSSYNYLYFRFKCPEISVIDKISIYFQSGNKGWHVYHAVVPLLTDQWQTILIPLSWFHKTGKPAGWANIRKIRLSVWQRKNVTTSVSIADLRVQKINAVNLVKNSGFEFCTTGLLPDYWGPGHWGLQKDPWITHMDQWRATWGVDHTISYQGRNSLRIIQSTNTGTRKAVSTFFPTTSKQPYTFSAWLKSDQAKGQKVRFKTYTLKNTWLNKTWTVTNTWKRYEVRFAPTRNSAQTRCEIGPVTAGTLWIDNVQVEKGPTSTTYQPAPRDVIITGTASQNHEPDIVDYPVIAGKNTGTVSIDTHRRFLVDGKPFIPTVLGWESTPTPATIKMMALSGFNTLCLRTRESETIKSLRILMDQAQADGLKVILWIGKKVSPSQMTDWINGLKDHPTLIAWYVYDEPSTPNSWKQANEKYEIIKSLDSIHPAYINLLFKKLKKDYPSDILCIDYYPLTFWSPASVSTHVRKLERIAAKAGKPSWTWLQNAGYAYFIFREPTDAEVQCMTYLALIHGSRAIKYFSHQSLGKGLWNEIRRLTGEIKKLTPILYSLEEPPAVSTTSPSINLLGKAYQGKKYIIAVNDLPSRIKASIKIPSLRSGTAKVLFERRTVRVRGNQIKDTFKSYQRHVYELEN